MKLENGKKLRAGHYIKIKHSNEIKEVKRIKIIKWPDRETVTIHCTDGDCYPHEEVKMATKHQYYYYLSKMLRDSGEVSTWKQEDFRLEEDYVKYARCESCEHCEDDEDVYDAGECLDCGGTLQLIYAHDENICPVCRRMMSSGDIMYRHKTKDFLICQKCYNTEIEDRRK